MARHECCREIETAIFAARTNLPVLDFQTWQVCMASQQLSMFGNVLFRNVAETLLWWLVGRTTVAK